MFGLAGCLHCGVELIGSLAELVWFGEGLAFLSMGIFGIEQSRQIFAGDGLDTYLPTTCCSPRDDRSDEERGCNGDHATLRGSHCARRENGFRGNRDVEPPPGVVEASGPSGCP